MRITILLLAILLTGCVTQKKCLEKFPPETKIVIQVVEKETIIYRDTTIYVQLPPKIIEVEKVIEVPKDFKTDTVYAYGEYSRAFAFVEFQKIKLRLHEGGELKIELNKALKEITRLKSEVKTETITNTVTEYKTKWYMTILAYFGIFSMIIFAAFLYLYFK